MNDPPADPDGLIYFDCRACGRTLTASSRQAGIAGPCPSCRAEVTAPVSGSRTVEAIIDSAAPGRPDRRAPRMAARRSKRRIVGDSVAHLEHLERRETFRSLKVITLFVLAISACLAVTWLLRDWIGK